MGLLGSALGRGLAGAGSAVAEISNKYIDADLANKRAQVLADIQRLSTVQTAKDLDAYATDPETVARKNAAASSTALAASEAEDKIKLRRLTDKPLMQAAIDAENMGVEGTSGARAKAAGALERAKTDNTGRVVNPGDEVIIGAGSNNRPTAAQLNLDALREGLKGQGREARDRMIEQALKDHGAMMKDLSSEIDKGLAAGTLSPTKPKDDKPNPQYEAYQTLLEKQRVLQAQRDKIIEMSRVDSAAKTGPRKSLGIDFGDDKKQPTGATPAPGGSASDATGNAIRANGDEHVPPGGDEIALTKAAFQTETDPATKDALAARLTQLGVKLDTGPAGNVPTSPPPAKTPLVQQASALDEDKAYVQRKLMGIGDGPQKLLEIAKTNPNPRFRAAAKSLYDEFIAKQSASPDTIAAPL